jgi:hypothetical protein
MVHRGNDDRRHAVRVCGLLRVPRLQWRQGGQELALLVHETDDVGSIAERYLVVEEGVASVVR